MKIPKLCLADIPEGDRNAQSRLLWQAETPEVHQNRNQEISSLQKCQGKFVKSVNLFVTRTVHVSNRSGNRLQNLWLNVKKYHSNYILFPFKITLVIHSKDLN